MSSGASVGQEDERVLYPVSELAARYGASAQEETADPKHAYARFESPQRGATRVLGPPPLGLGELPMNVVNV